MVLTILPAMAAVTIVPAIAVVVAMLVAIVAMFAAIAPSVPVMIIVPIAVIIGEGDIAEVEHDCGAGMMAAMIGCADHDARGIGRACGRECCAGERQRNHGAFQKHTHVEFLTELPPARDWRDTTAVRDHVPAGRERKGSEYTQAVDYAFYFNALNV